MIDMRISILRRSHKGQVIETSPSRSKVQPAKIGTREYMVSIRDECLVDVRVRTISSHHMILTPIDRRIFAVDRSN